MIMRPAATSARTSSGASCSRRATYSISSLMTPRRARCICDRLGSPVWAASALRCPIHSARGARLVWPLLVSLGMNGLTGNYTPRGECAFCTVVVQNKTQISRLGFPALESTRGSPPSLKMTTKKSESVLNDFFVAEGTAAAAFLHGLLAIGALDVINFRATEDAGEDHHDDEYCY